MNAGKAEVGALVLGVTRADARTLAFTTADYLEGVNLLRALITLASTR